MGLGGGDSGDFGVVAGSGQGRSEDGEGGERGRGQVSWEVGRSGVEREGLWLGDCRWWRLNGLC